MSGNRIVTKNRAEMASARARMLVCETMPKTLDAFRFLLMAVAGWMNQRQENAIEYLREENRVLRSQLGNRRVKKAGQP